MGVLQPPTKIVETLGPVERTFGPAVVMRWWPLLSGLGFGGIGVALVLSPGSLAHPLGWVGLAITLVMATVIALYPPGRVTVHERGLAARTWCAGSRPAGRTSCRWTCSSSSTTRARRRCSRRRRSTRPRCVTSGSADADCRSC